jgi:hypothetical protein
MPQYYRSTSGMTDFDTSGAGRALAGLRPSPKLVRHGIIVALLLLVGYGTGLTSSSRGWLTIGLAWLLLTVLMNGAGSGSRVGQLASHALAVLVTVLVIVGVQHAAPPKAEVKTPAGRTVTLDLGELPTKVRKAIDNLGAQAKAKAEANRRSPTTSTRPTRGGSR